MRKSIGFLFTILMMMSCGSKADEAAIKLCECNAELIAYNADRKALSAKNDVTGLATLMEKRDLIIEEAKGCFKEMENEIGKDLLESKDFEMELLPLLGEKCPETLKAYKKANNIK